MKTVLTYGTFDLFHIGHLRLLKRLQGFGDRVVVGLSTDEFTLEKGKKVVHSYAQREEILRAIRFVDDVFPERNWDQKATDIKRENASVFAMGDDWAGKFDNLSDIVEVIYLPRTENISTTEVKSVVTAHQQEKVNSIEHALEHVVSLVKQL